MISARIATLILSIFIVVPLFAANPCVASKERKEVYKFIGSYRTAEAKQAKWHERHGNSPFMVPPAMNIKPASLRSMVSYFYDTTLQPSNAATSLASSDTCYVYWQTVTQESIKENPKGRTDSTWVFMDDSVETIKYEVIENSKYLPCFIVLIKSRATSPCK